MGNVYKVDVLALCRARGWHIESDGGAADGWTARVGVWNDRLGDYDTIAEESAHSRHRARMAAYRAALKAKGERD